MGFTFILSDKRILITTLAKDAIKGRLEANQ